MNRDRFLFGILIGISALVVVALILFIVRQDQTTYVDEQTPEGVLRNYILAIQKRDYKLAYQYVAGKTLRVSQEQFQQPFLDYQENAITGTSVEIDQVILDSQGQTATIQVTVLSSARDLFGMSIRSHSTATLVRENGAWKINSFPYPYWPALPYGQEPALTPIPRRPNPTPTPIPAP